MWVSKFFEFTKKMTAHNESLDETISSNDLYFQKYTEVICQTLFFILWALSFYSFRLIRNFVEEFRYFSRLIKCYTVWNSASQHAILSSSVEKFGKKPNHIAIGLVFEKQGSPIIRFLKSAVFGSTFDPICFPYDQKVGIAKLVSWCWSAGIGTVSLYDPHGEFI